MQMHDDELDGSFGEIDGIDVRHGLKLGAISRNGRMPQGVGSMDDCDGDDTISTNYELIEYLKRREERDEEMLKRMDAREERLLNLFERTVVAIEALSAVIPKQNNGKANNEINSTSGGEESKKEEVMNEIVNKTNDDQQTDKITHELKEQGKSGLEIAEDKDFKEGDISKSAEEKKD